MKEKQISRQKFLRIAWLATGCLSLSPLLTGCGNDPTPSPTSLLSSKESSLAAPTTKLSSTLANTTPAVTAISATTSTPQGSVLNFPAGFLWGVATSAYQIEGAVNEDGRGESIWDKFCSSRQCNGDFGTVAADHYHRWETDLDLMEELGFQTYRFSIAWPRIVPQGTGAVNQKGLDFYKRLVEGLVKRNIVPMATLYHWDLPQTLEDKGGWTNRDTASYFAEYSNEVYKALGNQIPLWATINEPWVTANLGYGSGVFAPGRSGMVENLKATHYQLLGHGLAVQAFRSLALKNSQIGIALNTAPIYPSSDTEANKKVALIEDGTRNRLYLDPILKASYPSDLLDLWKRKSIDLNFMLPEDLRVIGQPIDFLGLNYYNPVYVRDGGDGSPQGVSGPHPHAQLSWEEIYPTALYDHLVRLKNDYKNISLYITENGAAYKDTLDATGQINDPDRLKYIHDHFVAAHQALANGVNLKGYYVWSFIDNFEWREGYSARFGIVYVDYPSQKRYPKRSALWYREVIKQNGVGELPPDIK